MASVEEKLSKLREERIAREKARIEKLRELNLKKYNKSETNPGNNSTKIPVANKFFQSNSFSAGINKNPVTNTVKNNNQVNGVFKRPISASEETSRKDISSLRKSIAPNTSRATSSISRSIPVSNKNNKIEKKPSLLSKAGPSESNLKHTTKTLNQTVNFKSQNGKVNAPTIKSFVPSRFSTQSKSFNALTKPIDKRKSVQPQTSTKSVSQSNEKPISVFERLYKPKLVPKVTIDDAQKLRADPSYLKKVIANSSLITGRRNTISQPSVPARRSISALHLKRASKSELRNCIHTWASIGEKLDKVDIIEVDEDASIASEKVVSAVRSERKKVKFQTPVSLQFNSPRPEELQARLQNWLQKRGKSIDSYHHLQCFGVYHLSKGNKPLETPKFESYDDENKENIAMESDSDDQSYTDNINDRKDDFVDNGKLEVGYDKWRRASNISESVSLNESKNTTLTSADELQHLDVLLLGALNDLTELLKEGFDWEQCARWLRAIRERFPSVPQTAAYWECRAALEEHRGNLPASLQCWEEAIAMGTERSEVEANLDQLLDKLVQLKISPNSNTQKKVDQKMVDVKNVFKSTIIRFALQKAKLRHSNQSDHPLKYTLTPVRRSGRLSLHGSVKRTPLQVCTTVSQAATIGHPVVFVPNQKLFDTP